MSDYDRLSYPVEEHVHLGGIATDDVAALVVAALEHSELTGSHFVLSGVENVTGVTGASLFIFDNTFAISGAQPPETIVQAMQHTVEYREAAQQA